jgi:hypothetical protein
MLSKEHYGSADRLADLILKPPQDCAIAETAIAS